MKKMGGKDATNAILANLRSKIFNIFRGSMPPDPLDRAKKCLPKNQPHHLETLLIQGRTVAVGLGWL